MIYSLSQSLILICYAVQVAVIVTLISAFGAVAGRVVQRAAAPFRHALLLSVLVTVMIAPVIAAVYQWQFLPRSPTAVRTTTVVATSQPTTFALKAPEHIGDYKKGPISVVLPHSHWWAFIVGVVFIDIWLLGIVYRFSKTIIDISSLRKFTSSLRPLQECAITKTADRLRGDLRIRRRVRIFASSVLSSPFTWGIFRPKIVVPDRFRDQNSPIEIEAILIHELAHVRRWDFAVGLLCEFFAIIYWWNPFLRRMFSEIDRAREEICDDFVVVAQKNGKTLAKSLVTAAEKADFSRYSYSVGIAGGTPRSLEWRVHRLIHCRYTPKVKVGFRYGIFVGALALLPLFGIVHTNYRWTESELTFQEGDGSRFSETAGAYINFKTFFGDPSTPDSIASNFGRSDRFWVENESPNNLYHTMLGFFDAFGYESGQIPIGATITSAELVMITDTQYFSGTTGSLTLHKVLAPWQEDTVNWNQVVDAGDDDQFDAAACASLASIAEGGEKRVRIDLTSVCQAWSNGDPNYGVFLTTESDNGAFFHSDDYSVVEQRPRLTVRYTNVPQQNSFVMLGLMLGVTGSGIYRRARRRTT